MLKTAATILIKLRAAFDKYPQLAAKKIGYTCRYNAFWNTPPDNWQGWNTDGEALTINNALKDQGKSLGDVIDYVNLMFYDQAPSDIGAPATGPTVLHYLTVIGAAEKYIPDRSKIMMGFEPGPQWNKGVWEGLDTDKQVIDYMKKNGYGGIFFWAINQHPDNGVNALKLADYAQNG